MSPCERASTCIRPSQPAQKTVLSCGYCRSRDLHSIGTHGVSPFARVMRFACPPPASRVSSSPPRVVGPGLRDFVSSLRAPTRVCIVQSRGYSEKAKVFASAETCFMGCIGCVGAPVVRKGHICEAFPECLAACPPLLLRTLADSFSSVMAYLAASHGVRLDQQH